MQIIMYPPPYYKHPQVEDVMYLSNPPQKLNQTVSQKSWKVLEGGPLSPSPPPLCMGELGTESQ